MANNPLVATRVPPAVMEQINADMETGYYRSVSDWVRLACIEYAKKRKEDRQGGGALIKFSGKKNFLGSARARALAQGPPAPRRFYSRSIPIRIWAGVIIL